MKTVLYADVLFLINFGMDLISLWLTFLIMKRSVAPPRMILSSLIGGIYGVVSVVADPGAVLSFLLTGGVSFLMIFISVAPGVKFRQLIKYTFILWGIGALLGGVVTFICTLGTGSAADIRSHNAPFFVFAVACSAVYGIVKLLSSVSSVKSCSVILSAFGADIKLNMLVDTGCLVVEPVSGSNVIFIKKDVFCALHNRDVCLLCGDVSNMIKLSPDTKRRSRVVTVKRAGEEKALISFFPDEVLLLMKNERKSVRCAAVIEDVPDYGGYDGILPASLLK